MKYIIITFKNEKIMIPQQADKKENLENIIKSLADKYHFSIATDHDAFSSSTDS